MAEIIEETDETVHLISVTRFTANFGQEILIESESDLRRAIVTKSYVETPFWHIHANWDSSPEKPPRE